MIFFSKSFKHFIRIQFICLFIYLPSYSQQLSNLISQLNQTKEDTNKVLVLQKIAAEEIQGKHLDKASLYANQALNLSEKLAYTKGLANSHFLLGRINRNQKNYTASLNYYLQSAIHFESIKDKRSIAELDDEIGFLYLEQEAYEKSVQYFLQSYEIKQQYSPEKSQAATLENIAYAYYQMEHYPNASIYYNKVLLLYKKMNNNQATVQTLEKLSSISNLQENYDKALEYNLEIIEVNRRLNDALSIASSLNNIGYVYKRLNDKKKSLRYFRQAADLNKQLNAEAIKKKITDRNAIYTTNMGVAYSNLGEYKNARKAFTDALKIKEAQNDIVGAAKIHNYLAANYFVSGNNEQALTSVFKAIEIGEANKSDEVLVVSYKILSDIYQKNNEFKESQRYYQLYQEVRDRLNEKQRKKQQSMLQNQMDIEKKEGELKLLIADKEKQALALKQLGLEAEKKEKELELRAKELALLKQNQELQAADLKNQQLEKDRVQQLLQLTRQRATAEKQQQEISLLQKNKEIQDLALKQREAKEKQRQKEIELLEKDKKLQKMQLAEEASIRRYGIILLSLLGVITLLILYAFVSNRRQSKLLASQNKEITQQSEVIKEKNEELQASEEELRQNMEELEANKEEIEAQKDALQQAFKIIEQKNLAFTQSVQYAEKIQQAILPDNYQLKAAFSEHFVIFKPKDIVSGDFYWFTKVGKKRLIAVVDCTGHGVPGAFMSLIGNSLLNEIVNQQGMTEPSKVLENLHINVRKALKQQESDSIDGMDIGLCCIEKWDDDLFSLQFSGAKNSIYYYTNHELHELKGDRKGIGGWQGETYRDFSNHVIQLKKGDTIYLLSDGFTDTPNLKRKKFGVKRLTEILQKEIQKPLKEQENIFNKALQEYQEGSLQRDDITFLGIRL